MIGIRKILQQNGRNIKEVNCREDLEEKLEVKDKVLVGIESQDEVYEMTYEGVINHESVSKIYHSFMRLGDNKKNIICWRSEIQYIQYKNGVIIFDKLNWKVELYPLESADYNIKQRMLV